MENLDCEDALRAAEDATYTPLFIGASLTTFSLSSFEIAQRWLKKKTI
jgi:hypothetical protein